jgi:hypothetical protein
MYANANNVNVSNINATSAYNIGTDGYVGPTPITPLTDVSIGVLIDVTAVDAGNVDIGGVLTPFVGPPNTISIGGINVTGIASTWAGTSQNGTFGIGVKNATAGTTLKQTTISAGDITLSGSDEAGIAGFKYYNLSAASPFDGT